MPFVVGVSFRPVTKVYYFDPAGHDDLQPDEHVVVETSRGRTIGQVVFAPKDVAPSEVSGALKPVVRRANAWDMVQADQMLHKEPETLAACRERVEALGLPMKIVKAEWSFDGVSLVVYFTSEQRIDFRSLVHDLAQTLRARVEMRQVGVRDEAKFIGGFGRCGRDLCCATWLREFTPVSIKMAKQQDLPLNTSEVSGACGRLLCCLSYENDFYAEARKQMPKVNSMLMTPQGPGKVKQVHVLANSVTVLVEGPGETRQMVDVLVPEPEFGAAGPSHHVAGLASEATGQPVDETEEGIPEPLSEEEPGDTLRDRVQPRAAAPGEGRRTRGRRRRR